MTRREPDNVRGFHDVVGRICDARTVDAFRDAWRAAEAFEGGKFRGEFGQVWMTRWSMVFGDAPPPAID